MGEFSHFVIVVIETKEGELDGKKAVYAEATRQIVEFHNKRVKVFVEMDPEDEKKDEYHFLGDKTVAVKKIAEDGSFISAKDLGEPHRLDAPLEHIQIRKGVLKRKINGFKFEGTYFFNPRGEDIYGSFYHVVLPDSLCLDKNTVWKYGKEDPLIKLREKRYTVTWHYPGRKIDDYPIYRPHVEFYYDEERWEQLITTGETSWSISPEEKWLYGRAEYWVPVAFQALKPGR